MKVFRNVKCSLLLLTWLSSGLTESVVASSEFGQRDHALKIDKIIAAWTARRYSLSSVSMQWRITRQDRSASFGPLDSPNSLHVLLSGSNIRLKGKCPPPYGVLSSRASFARDPLGKIYTNQRFAVALGSRFSLNCDEIPTTSQQYDFLRGADREVHFWDADGSSGMCGGIFLPGEAAEFVDIPTVSLLADALVCSLHLDLISLSQQQGGQYGFRIASEHGMVNGISCVCLEQEDADGDNISLSRVSDIHRYHVDLTKHSRVLRYTIASSEGVLKRQYDFSFPDDSNAINNEIPCRIMLTQFNGPLVVHDILLVVLEQLDLTVELDEDAFSLEFPPTTLVTDFINHTQYVVTEGGKQQVNAVHGAIAPIVTGETSRQKGFGYLVVQVYRLALLPLEYRVATMLIVGVAAIAWRRGRSAYQPLILKATFPAKNNCGSEREALKSEYI